MKAESGRVQPDLKREACHYHKLEPQSGQTTSYLRIEQTLQSRLEKESDADVGARQADRTNHQDKYEDKWQNCQAVGAVPRENEMLSQTNEYRNPDD